MTNTTPVLGRNASLTIGGAEVGYLKGVTLDLEAVVIKDYKFTQDDPAVLESGNKSYKFTFDKMYIDSTFQGDLFNATKVSQIIIGPASSTPTGQPKYTLGNCIITKSSIKMDQGGIVLEHGEGEALTLAIGLY